MMIDDDDLSFLLDSSTHTMGQPSLCLSSSHKSLTAPAHIGYTSSFNFLFNVQSLKKNLSGVTEYQQALPGVLKRRDFLQW